MSQPLVLVTGATGFVGEAVVFRLLIDKAFTPLATVRSQSRISGLCKTVYWDMNSPDIGFALDGIHAIVHCAARVHVMDETAPDAIAEFRKINVNSTLNLARKAANSGVKRFIYISSIKVNGETTLPGHPFTSVLNSVPKDPYGLSKFEAEEGLGKISLETGMELVVIRPPLVYGPGVKANFLNMMNWLDKEVPLPLGAIHNQRSLVFIENLVDLIVTCISHPSASGRVLMVSDGADISTSQLLGLMAKALGKKSRLLSVPVALLKLAGFLTGRRDVTQRLCSSLQVDISDTCSLLGWFPPITRDLAFRRSALHFQDNRKV
ncbi:SDR family oxidoreductase [Pseudomonas serboccidentalis]|uniref:SDR family oxidoreductase n=1 Tax=Pseudomonas serboccidentalis TaxID=2964670 RepID=A0ABY7Z3C6_9PSED|nr:SDR family oxidoreductase [Pseudomonas serboccidentalis]WDR34138.1 SDR family oxidoreductase [Pseudomonas serboccidentalis]